jgi:putative hemolysin
LDPESTGLLVLALLSLVGLAVAVLAETALGSLSRARVQHLIETGHVGVIKLESFVERPAGYLQSMHVLRTLLTVASAVFGTGFVFSVQLDPILGLATSLVGVSIVVVAVYAIPRTIAVGRAESVSATLATFIRFWSFVLWPVVRALSGLSGLLASIVGVRPPAEGPLASTEELRTLVTVGEQERLIEENEREMIDSIFDLEETTVREIMVPRMDVIALADDTAASQAIDTIVAHGYSRLPIYEQTIDNITGILYAKDLFRLLTRGGLEVKVKEIARPAHFIPESKKVDELLRELQQRKVHIAIIVDEYGGTAGLVTIEDLLEEIVGEIQDEYDREEAKIVEMGDGEAIFDATVSIHDVNDTLSLHLEGEDVDTVGGLVYETLGKVPSPGDQITLDGGILTVVSTVGRRIKKVRVTRVPLLEPGTGDLTSSQ